MLANLVRSIFPSNPSQSFEKARIQATCDGDTNPPQEIDLTNILLAFTDKNPEIRGTAAFYLTLASMQANKTLKQWNYVLKNFVLFDRALDEKCFAKEISELNIEQLVGYKKISGTHGEKLDAFLKRYFRYIKAKGRVYSTKHFQFNHSYEQKKKSLESLTHDKLFLESKKIKSLIVFAFDVFETGVQEIIKYKLNQYIFLLIINTLIKVFSFQYLVFVVLIDTLSTLEVNRIHELYDAFQGFLQDVNRMMSYCNNWKTIPSLQISQEKIFDIQAGASLLKLLEDYINTYSHKRDERSSKTKPRNFVSHNFSPKAPEVSLARVTEISVPKHGGDDNVESSLDFGYVDSDSKETERPFASVCSNMERTCDSPIKYQSGRIRSPKSITKAFKDSFYTGFNLEMDEDRPNIKDLNEKDRISVNKFKEGKIIVKEDNPNVPELFTDLLCLGQPDELFEKYDNFYSNHFSEQTKKEIDQFTSVKNNTKFIELKTKGYVPNLEEESKKLEFKFQRFDDFDPNLFDSFKNNFSTD